MKTLLLVCFSLVACGGAPFSPTTTCSYRDFKVYVQSSTQDCAFFERRIDAALDLLTVKNPWAKSEDFKGLSLWIHDESPSILCSGSGQTAAGCYHLGENWIELTRSGSGLAHELLHHVDFLAGRKGRNHKGWGTEGENVDLNNCYVLEGEPELVCAGSWRDLTQRFLYDWDFLNK